MKCYKAKRILPLFLEGHLGKKCALKLKSHLDNCPSCTKESHLLKQSWDLLENWQPITPSDAFKTNLWQRILQEETVREKKPFFVLPQLQLRFAPAFATVAIILISFVFIGKFLFIPNVGQVVSLTKGQDIYMLKEFELAEQFEIIQNINILEDFEAINSLEI